MLVLLIEKEVKIMKYIVEPIIVNMSGLVADMPCNGNKCPPRFKNCQGPSDCTCAWCQGQYCGSNR